MTDLSLSAAAVDAPPCRLGESPRWGHGAWWWVDAEAGLVWTAGPGLLDGQGEARVVASTGERTSLVQPGQDGTLVVAAGSTLLVLDPATGRMSPWAQVDLPGGWLLNDGTADEAGRLWVGSVHPQREPGAGALHVIDPSGRVREVADGLTLSNGMAWVSPSLLVHADSLERCLWEHTVDLADGRVVDSRRALTLPPGPGDLALPDGVAADEAGGLWVAMYGSGEIWHVVRRSVQAVVRVPAAQVTSVALGGPDGRDMLVTTAREGMDDAAIAADPYSGRLFRARAPRRAAAATRARPAGVR